MVRTSEDVETALSHLEEADQEFVIRFMLASGSLKDVAAGYGCQLPNHSHTSRPSDQPARGVAPRTTCQRAARTACEIGGERGVGHSSSAADSRRTSQGNRSNI